MTKDDLKTTHNDPTTKETKKKIEKHNEQQT